ncbi:exodeoxyribonuclease VII large subunit [Acuticoccus mangrovi]|uniref:Exodeoxyribonuclease 7 large subunit n=1 Tax=Acuticoccus mangrovi TaxID=2796142 RepID=A0A934MF75_9HYPH|nr:exodeoxyribonuclease VII large subunit [Acuticoccus mangrovi]MBJ3775168.1 exodeoxyribonuclease VII large subunit [Acuticoccus mangrovi]
MSDPFPLFEEAGRPRSNAAEFTVSELSRAVKRTVEDGFGQVRVRGEISGFRGRHSSGHCYFSLKDVDASIDAVVWRGAFARLGVKPEEGLEVIATGRLTTFPRKSSYQIVVEQLEHAGLGALMKLLEERRRKLAAEGLFDEARKRPLPSLPGVIGVVTSPTGAVIRDILHRVSDRFPSRVIVWPVRVQGETSGAEVAAAVRGFAGDYGGPLPDVIIVARGGGSVEDLWGYNDEEVVRAVVASPIPVVSAVGHETDWTLIDYAADHRAPTPTGAAERVVPVRADCLSAVADRSRRLDVAMATYVHRRTADLRLLSRGLPAASALLQGPRQRLDLAGDRLSAALFRATAEARRRYLATATRLSPHLAARPVEAARERLSHTLRRLHRAVDHIVADRRLAAARTGGRLAPHLLTRRLDEARLELKRLTTRRDRAADALLGDASTRLAAAAKLLDAVSYRSVLSRGFALVWRANDEPVRSAAAVAKGEALEVQFADGRVSVVEASTSPRPAQSRVKRVSRSRKVDDRQGSLF